MPKKSFLVTTALVLCVSTSFAAQETGTPGAGTIPPFTTARVARQHERSVAANKFEKVSRNAQFISWYGPSASHNASTVLYEQSASSGFAKYAVPSWWNDSSYGHNYISSSMAADDFIIPGTGKHDITAIYAAGVSEFHASVVGANVIFFDTLKYSKKTGTTTAIVKAKCSWMPVSYKGYGNLVVDVSSCNLGRFKGGHDYSVSVQGITAGSLWSWQTNRKRIKREGLWVGNRGGCTTQFMPIKTCFPTKGYGRDLAFAIYGN